MKKMEVEMISQLIGQMGFPIFVAVFMLVKQSKDTENISRILTELKVAIEALSKDSNKG